jgi:hypothetical protein
MTTEYYNLEFAVDKNLTPREPEELITKAINEGIGLLIAEEIIKHLQENKRDTQW